MTRLTARRRSAVMACTLLAAWALQAHARSAQVSPRLYVFDGGSLLDGNTAVVAYLIVHPKGTLMWEAGTVPDAVVSGGAAARRPELVEKFNARASKTLASQLASVGQAPGRITYFAASHYHFDHIANASIFPSSVWLVQQREYDAMFGSGPTPFGAEPSYYAPLQKSKKLLLKGDHDVFGDGTVVLKSAPGHTPGHQILFVKLARTGPVVLGGDIYHNPSERRAPLDTVPAMDSNPNESKTTRTMLEAFVKQTGAAFWIEHDGALFKTQRKAPEYYD